MKVIGVTGGIGSGKSTVARILQDLGARIVDADKIARRIVVKGGKPLQDLVAFFGDEILDANGELNRKKLADIVFNKPEKLLALNRITHGYIADEIIRAVSCLKKDNAADIIVIDAPIPIEHGFIDQSDEIWVVTAGRETRVSRIMERSGFTREEAEERIDMQKSDDAYLGLADEVIVNEGSIEELENNVAKLFVKIKGLR